SGRVQMETHAIGIDDFNVAELVALLLRPFVAQKTKFDVLRRERVTIVKFESLAQFKLVHLLVRAHGPRLGQRGRHGVPRHGLEQGIMQSVEEPEGRHPSHCHLARIEPGRSEGHVQGPAHLPCRLWWGRSPAAPHHETARGNECCHKTLATYEPTQYS